MCDTDANDTSKARNGNVEPPETSDPGIEPMTPPPHRPTSSSTPKKHKRRNRTLSRLKFYGNFMYPFCEKDDTRANKRTTTYAGEDGDRVGNERLETMPWHEVFAFLEDPMDLICFSHTCRAMRACALSFPLSSSKINPKTLGLEATRKFNKRCCLKAEDPCISSGFSCVVPEIAAVLFAGVNHIKRYDMGITMAKSNLDYLVAMKRSPLPMPSDVADTYDERVGQLLASINSMVMNRRQSIFHILFRLLPINCVANDIADLGKVFDYDAWIDTCRQVQRMNAMQLFPVEMAFAAETQKPPYLEDSESKKWSKRLWEEMSRNNNNFGNEEDQDRYIAGSVPAKRLKKTEMRSNT